MKKYLIRWKRFIVEHDTWEKREDLGNTRGALEEFEGKMNVEVRRQEKLDMMEKKNFRRGELPGKYKQRCYMDGMTESLKRSIEKVGEKLVKMEVSFSREETLKRR